MCRSEVAAHLLAQVIVGLGEGFRDVAVRRLLSLCPRDEDKGSEEYQGWYAALTVINEQDELILRERFEQVKNAEDAKHRVMAMSEVFDQVSPEAIQEALSRIKQRIINSNAGSKEYESATRTLDLIANRRNTSDS